MYCYLKGNILSLNDPLSLFGTNCVEVCHEQPCGSLLQIGFIDSLLKKLAHWLSNIMSRDY